MIRKSLFAAIVLFMAYSCKNSASKESQAADTTAASTEASDTMHHDTAAVAIAPVPDIPAGAKVFFKNLKSGSVVSSPFKVVMAVENLKVDTAKGQPIAGSGHHHILINSGDSLAMGTVIPKDSTHLHFGNAQTETQITLAPGKYHLTLQFADGLHRSYGGRLASSVDITVKKK